MNDQQNASGGHADTVRRNNNERRVSISATTVENREGDERRTSEDRRGHYQNLFSTDDNFLYEVFAWLIDCTGGEWSSGPNDNEPDGSPVTCRVRFDDPADLEKFVQWLAEWQEKHG